MACWVKAPLSAAVTPAGDDPPPIRAVGVLQRGGPDQFWFRLADGSSVALTFEQLTTRQALIGLFGGEAWLRRRFPGQFTVVANRDGGGRTVATGINVVQAAQYLAQLCINAEQEAAATEGLSELELRPRRGRGGGDGGGAAL